MGQRGQLDRILVAHSGPILALDWSLPPSSVSSNSTSSSRSAPHTTWYGAATGGSGIFDEILPGSGSASTSGPTGDATGAGWLVSGGLDHCVKVSITSLYQCLSIMLPYHRYGTSHRPRRSRTSRILPHTSCVRHTPSVAFYGARIMSANLRLYPMQISALAKNFLSRIPLVVLALNLDFG